MSDFPIQEDYRGQFSRPDFVRLTILEKMRLYPPGSRWLIEHDGFIGEVCGYYVRRDDRPGVVLQQDGTNVVHVYNTKWLKPVENSP